MTSLFVVVIFTLIGISVSQSGSSCNKYHISQDLCLSHSDDATGEACAYMYCALGPTYMCSPMAGCEPASYASKVCAAGNYNCYYSDSASKNLNTREFYEKSFFEWMEKFSVKFENGAEFIHRLQVFADNFDMIQSHNRGGASYTLGINQFAHLTHREFLDEVRIGGTRIPATNLRRGASGSPLHDIVEGETNPSSVDWVAAGAVTPVKDQGNCGSCWSFSATGSLEGAYYIKNQKLESFSEQQLVSCDTTDAGCNGGWMDDAFAWAKKNNGLCTEASYPYISGTTGQSGACKRGCPEVEGSAPVSWVDVTPGSVEALESAVALTPVSIAIQADQPAFQFYEEGVLTGTCGQSLDHGVLAVGYGVYTDGTPYWKVKNSWGASWGMDGYILIEKSSTDLCGVLDAASYPKL